MVAEKAEPARRFEDLWIWQRARVLAGMVYEDIGPGSPSERDYSFNVQIRRAAISIMNNISEGFERKSDAEFARFVSIAKGSCGEIRSMYYLAEDRHYVDRKTAESRRDLAREIAGGISSLIVRLKTSR